MNRVTIEQNKGRTIENNRVSKNSAFLLWVNCDPWAYIIPKGGFSHSLELRSLPPLTKILDPRLGLSVNHLAPIFLRNGTQMLAWGKFVTVSSFFLEN